jgi:hypothetical protein
MISADLPFSVWLPLMADNDLPDDAALIEVRITDNGKPVPVAYDNGKVDESATLYIKSCGNLQLFIYHSTADSHLLWPLDGLQFRYVTESQLRESTC